MELNSDLRVHIKAGSIVLVGGVIGAAGGAGTRRPDGNRSHGKGSDQSTAGRRIIVGQRHECLARGEGLDYLLFFWAIVEHYIEGERVVVSRTQADVLIDCDGHRARDDDFTESDRVSKLPLDTHLFHGTEGTGVGTYSTDPRPVNPSVLASTTAAI